MAISWTPWGKLRVQPDGTALAHPLVDHMTDVALVFDALVRVPSIRRALECVAGHTLCETTLARLAVLVFLHDIGKANAGFQTRYWPERGQRPQGWFAVPESGHGPQGWALFDVNPPNEARRVLAGLPLADMDTWGPGLFTLLHASISHHGRPVTPDPAEVIWKPVRDGTSVLYDPAEAVTAMGRRVRALFPKAFEPAASDLPQAPAFGHYFSGLVQFADWLGSDTRERFFPYSEPGEDRTATAVSRARHALRAVGIDAGDVTSRLASTTGNFTQAFGVPAPRQIQTALADDQLGPVVVLEAETGSGKTEAALWRFLHMWRSGKVDGLYFALPTRVAATQLYDRVLSFVQNAWQVSAPVTVRALPGYTAADGATCEPLPGFQVLWHDDARDNEAERRWAAESSKRYLAATIAVGTVDQALLGALQIKHAHLRHAMLARSLLVVDEVHASDAYMTRLLEHLLRAHVTSGGQALLLSATLGAAARTRYLSIGGAVQEPIPPMSVAQALPYQAISHRTQAGPALLAVRGNPHHKTLHWSLLDIMDAPDRIAAIAVQAAAAGARVLVVRNTVPAAVATLRAVEALSATRGLDCLFRVGNVSTLHHGRFSRQDRPLLDAEIEAQIGKHRKPRDGLIVVGTQTLEQSLDIDADLLVTDLCPMDVLLQRLGRLHRHARPDASIGSERRPDGFDEARAWVLTPPGHNLTPLLGRARHGLGPIRIAGEPMAGVYVDLRVLEATRRLIAQRPTPQIPADNRTLVEQATHPEALQEIARALGKDWMRFGTEYDGTLAARKTVAMLHALPFDKAFDDVIFPVDEGRIGSRLGASDRLVVFDTPPAGPFGFPVEQLAIRHHMLPRALPIDAQPRAVAALDGEPGLTFELGQAQYRYSRLGLERISATTDRTQDHAA